MLNNVKNIYVFYDIVDRVIEVTTTICVNHLRINNISYDVIVGGYYGVFFWSLAVSSDSYVFEFGRCKNGCICNGRLSLLFLFEMYDRSTSHGSFAVRRIWTAILFNP